MGVLFVNYAETAKDDTQKNAAFAEAKELFVRVKEQSNDVELKQLALNLEAMCALALGRPNEAIELLQDVKPPPAHEGWLAQAYMMIGKKEEARTQFQKRIYYNLHTLLKMIPQYLSFCADDGLRVEEICKRTRGLIDTFNLKTIDPTGVLPFYLIAAEAYAENGKAEQALAMLETYTEIAVGVTYPLEFLKGDTFFDSLKNLEEKLSFGQAEMPRDETSVRRSIAEEVTENPVFSALSEEPRFKRLCGELRRNLK